MGLENLLGGLLGGGGLSPSSSTAQSSPFYNDSGIYFNSPGAGTISGSGSNATADPSRQNAGGMQAVSDNQLGYPNLAAGTATSSSILLWVGAGIIALGLGAYLLFKK